MREEEIHQSERRTHLSISHLLLHVLVAVGSITSAVASTGGRGDHTQSEDNQLGTKKTLGINNERNVAWKPVECFSLY